MWSRCSSSSPQFRRQSQQGVLALTLVEARGLRKPAVAKYMRLEEACEVYARVRCQGQAAETPAVRAEQLVKVTAGLGRIVRLHHRPSTFTPVALSYLARPLLRRQCG